MARNDAGLHDGASQRFRELREEFWQNVNVPGQRDDAEPEPRVGRPRRRLPGVRRAAVRATPCTATSRAAATSARSTRPPDGEAQRDDEQLRVRRRLGVHGRRQAPRLAQGAAQVRERPPRPSGATSERATGTRYVKRLAAARTPATPGRLVDYAATDVSTRHVVPRDARRPQRGADPRRARSRSRSTHDCREGICGTCGADDQRPRRTARITEHRPTCQLHMRDFTDGDDDRHRAVAGARRSRSSRTWSSTASAFDRIIQAGGYVSVNTGGARRQRAPGRQGRSPTRRWTRPRASAAARASAACKNASAMLFVAAKVSHLALLPQGQPERADARPCAWSSRWTPRASATARTTASARRPARRSISIDNIARMNRQYTQAILTGAGEKKAGAGGD